jgi:uncharacterized protein (DUF1778 family)
MTEVKAERLQVRVDQSAKRLLEEAAEVESLSTSAFVLQAGIQRAEEVLAERRLIKLGSASAQAFAEVMSAPAQVNERLLNALQRPTKVRWLD